MSLFDSILASPSTESEVGTSQTVDTGTATPLADNITGGIFGLLDTIAKSKYPPANVKQGTTTSAGNKSSSMTWVVMAIVAVIVVVGLVIVLKK